MFAVFLLCSHAPDSLPRLWAALRARWEYGHLAGSVLELLGLASLLWSVLTEHPGPSGRGFGNGDPLPSLGASRVPAARHW